MDHDLEFNGARAERSTAAMLSAPPTKHAAVDVSGGDVTFTAPYPRVLFIGVAGNVVVTDLDGNDETYTVPAGYELAGFFKGVKQTGTTGTNIVARW